MRIKKSIFIVFVLFSSVIFARSLLKNGLSGDVKSDGPVGIPEIMGEIAFTFDDAPRSSKEMLTADERTQMLIKNLKAAKIPDVVFFIKTSNINNESNRRLKSYIQAGYHFANHSHSHFDSHKVDVEAYVQDIKKAHDILSGFANFLPYYRYPLLHEGKTRETRDKINKYLIELGYMNGYVTVDNYDWYMDTMLQRAVKEGRKINFQTLKKAYVDSLWESISFYDSISRQVLGRSVKHVLLLHENDMAALFVGDLAAHIRNNGWKIISPSEAYSDPISKMIPDVLFNNQGRVAAIAREKGYKGRQLVHESEDVEYLEELFEKRGVFGLKK